MCWAEASWESSSYCPPPPVTVRPTMAQREEGGVRLELIGPRCSQGEELLHGGCFNLNIQLPNSGLQRQDVTTVS